MRDLGMWVDGIVDIDENRRDCVLNHLDGS